MSQEPLTNEQKLETVYQILQKQESRRKAAIFGKFLKWSLILGILYLVVTDPQAIIGKVMNVVEPIIVSTAGNLAAKIMPQVQEQLNASLSGSINPDEIMKQYQTQISQQISTQLPQSTGSLSQEELIRQQQEELIRRLRAMDTGSTRD